MSLAKRLMMAALFMVVSATYQSANAGTQSGKIVWLQTRESDGLVAVQLDGVRYNKPSCATYDYWIVKNENSENGKKNYSLLLAAYMSGKAVYIDGLNTCSRWPDGEDINVIRLNAQ